MEFLNCSVDRGLIREKPEGSLAKNRRSVTLGLIWRVRCRSDDPDLLRARERRRSPAGGSVHGGAERGSPEMAELGPPGV